MTGTANLGTQLARAIGGQRVIAGEEELSAYAVDGLVPAVIVQPVSADEVAEVVRFAIAEKLAILPLGSRSKCDLGYPPERYDIAIDMTGLRQVAHYDPGDLTLSVDAGMPLRDLEGQLKEKGQFLPLAVPCFETSTAGGTIASGIDSALRQQCGSARDFLIGAEFVDGTGQLCKSGGRVVKNVTGYDLHKLLLGSLGTLAVITRLNFRTFPLPARVGGHLTNFADCQSALRYQKAVEQAGLPLANQEVFNPRMTEMLAAILRRDGEALPFVVRPGEWCVYSSFDGIDAVVERISRDLERIARQSGARSSDVLETVADETLGGMLREAFEWLRWGSQTSVICRLTLPEVKPELLGELSHLAESDSLRPAMLIRTTGVVYFTVFAECEDERSIRILSNVVTRVRDAVREAEGNVGVLHAPRGVKQKAISSRFTSADRAMQQGVKLAFDPFNVFAPGRVVGGV